MISLRLFLLFACCCTSLLSFIPVVPGAELVSTAQGSGADVEMRERIDGGFAEGAFNTTSMNTRTSGGGDRNEIIGLKFDLSGYSLPDLTNVTLNLIAYRNDSNTRVVRLYGVTQGTFGGTGNFDTETWSDTNLTLFGDLPGLEASDGDPATQSLNTGSLTLLGEQTIPGDSVLVGETISFGGSAITHHVQAYPGSQLITFLLAAGNSSSGQFRIASKEADALDPTTVNGDPGDFAPFMQFDVLSPPPASGLIITNTVLVGDELVLSGTGGHPGGLFSVLATSDLWVPVTNWPAISTNQFDEVGGFTWTNSIVGGLLGRYYRILIASAPAGDPPSIVTQPVSTTVGEGATASFSVEVAGSDPRSFKWYFNVTDTITSADTNVLYIVNAAKADEGSYTVVVTNLYGAVTSSPATLTVTSGPVVLPGAYYVSPTGSDTNAGTLLSPFRTITKGLNIITTSGTLYLRGGIYEQPTKLTLSRIGATNGAIRVWAYPGEVPVIDSSGNSSDGISISGRWYHLKGLTVVKAGHNGINISGHSNLVEFCTVRSNGNTGLHITGGSSGTTYPSYNLILNCDAYLNYDPPIGGNADGFSAKWNLGPGNVFRGCRAWWNSDDGWDLWMGTAPVLIDACWSFYNGTNYWNSPQFDGNGQGFKLGGNYVGAPHRLVRSVAFRNESNGIDQNNNTAGQTVENSTAWANAARNINLSHNSNNEPMTGNHLVRNNLSFGGGNSDAFWPGSILVSNSWQVISSPSAGASDVLSTDASVSAGSRNADGSLPYWPFLRPVPSGRLIDRGVDIGDPFSGSAPDLGAFEDGL